MLQAERLQRSRSLLLFFTYFFCYSIRKCFGVDFPGKMDRTFTVDRVPASRVCRAEKLRLNTYFSSSVVNRCANYFTCSIPGRGTRCASHYPDLTYGVVLNLNLIFRSTKVFSIFSQANLPGKTTSGRGSEYPLTWNFFPR